jgi:hypothetical protein
MNKTDAENFLKLVDASCDLTNDGSLARYRKIAELIAPLIDGDYEFNNATATGSFEKIKCERCCKFIANCICEVCPYCNTNMVDIDDFGLTCCQACFDAHPEWKSKMNKLAYDERADSGHPINEDD